MQRSKGNILGRSDHIWYIVSNPRAHTNVEVGYDKYDNIQVMNVGLLILCAHESWVADNTNQNFLKRNCSNSCVNNL